MSSSAGSSDRHAHVAARTLRDEVEFAIGALRSNQDVLLHKVERSNVVREQLDINRNAIRHLQAALSRV